MTGPRESVGISARKHGAAQRLFFAVAIPDERPESYHLTLRFLGNVANDALPELVEAVREGLSGAAPSEVSPCVVQLGAPAAFPNGRRPRVVILPVTPEEPLAELASRIEAAVVDVGLKPERHRFRAHLTLGRVRARRLPVLQDAPAPALASVPVRQVVLFRSDLAPDGARYTPIQELSLASPTDAGPLAPGAGTTHSPSFNT
jgi:2'-5' RNA ligase